MNRYISDLHFGHANVIRFDGRPFADTKQMEEVLIDNWNGVVTEKDTTFILGDFCWGTEPEWKRIVPQLNGDKVLIRGNHDLKSMSSGLKKMFQDMVDNLFKDTGKTIIRTANEIRFNQIGEQLSPYQLSAGEKQILAILLTVLVEDNQSYVLFMDEPEISLHFEWQKLLIGLVLQLNPNIQIIMTTHSPAVVMDGWTDRVTDVNDITIS